MILPKNLPKIQIEFSFAAGKVEFFFAIELSSAGAKVEEPQLREGFAEMQGAWQGRTWQGKHKNKYRARCRNLFSCPEQLNRTPCPLVGLSVTTNNQSLHNTTE